MEIPKIFSSIGRSVRNLVRRTCFSKTSELKNDVAEISTKVKSKVISKISLDKKTIAQLEKLPVEEFLTESQKIIMKALDIPEDICPKIKFGQLHSQSVPMQYGPNTNVIRIEDDICAILPKPLLFSGIGHEMKHCEQNLAVLRTEKLGEEAINDYSEMLARAQANYFVTLFRDMPQGEIQKLQEANKITATELLWIEKLKKIPREDNQAIEIFSEEVYNHNFKIHYTRLNNIRSRAIEIFGIINSGSKEALEARKYFDGFRKVSGKVHGFSYWFSKHEREAYGVTISTFKEYLLKKFFG